MYCARDERSPEAYFLKKSAGKDSTRIMVAACTDKDILVLIRAISRDFTDVISIVLMLTLIINTVMPMRS